jgi:predicted tellurium resistance membrane protein TerC
VVIEVMDVVFAIDSVPAILAITSDHFLVLSSNVLPYWIAIDVFFLGQYARKI